MLPANSYSFELLPRLSLKFSWEVGTVPASHSRFKGKLGLRCTGQKVLNVVPRLRFRAFCPLRLESLWTMSFRHNLGFVSRSET